MLKNKVLVGGCFDVLHLGHIRFLKKAKSLGNYLVVLLESDENIKKLKGVNRPFHNIRERREVLESLKYIDEVVILPKHVNDKTYDNLIKKIKPNVIATTEGDLLINKKREQAKSVGAKLKIIKKYKSHSSSKIVDLLGF